MIDGGVYLKALIIDSDHHLDDKIPDKIFHIDHCVEIQMAKWWLLRNGNVIDLDGEEFISIRAAIDHPLNLVPRESFQNLDKAKVIKAVIARRGITESEHRALLLGFERWNLLHGFPTKLIEINKQFIQLAESQTIARPSRALSFLKHSSPNRVQATRVEPNKSTTNSKPDSKPNVPASVAQKTAVSVWFGFSLHFSLDILIAYSSFLSDGK